jgi:hypothetical protein
MPGNPARVQDLLKLKEIWEDLGLTVRAMEGWRDRGRASGNSFEVLGCHHTGDAVDIDSTLRNGRPGINGPLCNVALHKNGDVVLVASGRANHFGCATWPNSRSLGVEATGPQKTGAKFPNRDAYELLAVGFCMFKGNADPRKVVKSDVGIPVHLVAAHKEVGVGAFEDGKFRCNARTKKIYGRKPDPTFEDADKVMTGALDHGFSVTGSGVRLIDTFRARVHARMTSVGTLALSTISEEDDMTTDELLDALESPRGKAILRSVISAALGTVIRGDEGTPGGGTHPDNLRNIHKTVKEIRDRLPG